MSRRAEPDRRVPVKPDLAVTLPARLLGWRGRTRDAELVWGVADGSRPKVVDEIKAIDLTMTVHGRLTLGSAIGAGVCRFVLAEVTGSVGRVVFLVLGGVLAGLMVFFGVIGIVMGVQRGPLMDPRSVRQRRWIIAAGAVLAGFLGLCVALASFGNEPHL